MSYEDFRVNVKNQPIWCNKYIKFEGETLLFKSWIEDGNVMFKKIRINNGILDIFLLENIIQDKRQFYREINILQEALREAKLDVSIEPCRDPNVPVYIHNSDELPYMIGQ